MEEPFKLCGRNGRNPTGLVAATTLAVFAGCLLRLPAEACGLSPALSVREVPLL
jgi:hypothetical protein